MDTNCNNCRRSFFKKCAALTVGATLIGPGLKLLANPTYNWRYIGYCGAKCDNSCTYFLNGQCPGCNKTNPTICSVAICGNSKQIHTCAHCDELDTCDDQFWTDNPNAYTRVKKLRDSLTITAIEKNATGEKEIQLFPNPAQDYLKIKNPHNSGFNYELVSMNGKILRKGTIESKELTLNISDLKPGSYLFKLIRNNNALQIHKIIKQ